MTSESRTVLAPTSSSFFPSTLAGEPGIFRRLTDHSGTIVSRTQVSVLVGVLFELAVEATPFVTDSCVQADGRNPFHLGSMNMQNWSSR